MEYISSIKNNKVKELKKLLTHRGRKKAQQYLLEGEHLIQEALANQVPLLAVYVTTEYLNQDRLHLVRDNFQDAIEITTEVAQAITDTVSPQGIIALAAIPAQPKLDLTKGQWLLLDEVQDPGNVGTMIRTADAANLTGVIVSSNSVDIYAPKVQRAMQGSQFHLKVVSADLSTTIAQLQANQITVYGSCLDKTAADYRKVTPPTNWALVMGNEARGMNKETLQQVDQNLYIPIWGRAESLNVAVAAGIIIYRLSDGGGQ